MTAIEYLVRPPSGWFVVDVMRKESRSWDWVALMIDVDPETEDFLSHRVNPSAPGCWVSIPGKHKGMDSAWDALQDVMATRH